MEGWRSGGKPVGRKPGASGRFLEGSTLKQKTGVGPQCGLPEAEVSTEMAQDGIQGDITSFTVSL